MCFRESCIRQIGLCSLSGGRRPARKRASSDPTMLRPSRFVRVRMSLSGFRSSSRGVTTLSQFIPIRRQTCPNPPERAERRLYFSATYQRARAQPPDLKAVKPARVSWVRIPPPPPEHKCGVSGFARQVVSPVIVNIPANPGIFEAPDRLRKSILESLNV